DHDDALAVPRLRAVHGVGILGTVRGGGGGGCLRAGALLRMPVAAGAVLVVAATRLAPVHTRGDVTGRDGRGPPAGLPEALFEEALGDLQAGVDADEVHQLERPHAKAALHAADAVDLLDASDALRQQAQCLQAEGSVA